MWNSMDDFPKGRRILVKGLTYQDREWKTVTKYIERFTEEDFVDYYESAEYDENGVGYIREGWVEEPFDSDEYHSLELKLTGWVEIPD